MKNIECGWLDDVLGSSTLSFSGRLPPEAGNEKKGSRSLEGQISGPASVSLSSRMCSHPQCVMSFEVTWENRAPGHSAEAAWSFVN